MAHPHFHAVNSAKKFGGEPGDYIDIHNWFDATKAHIATPVHRALRHHTAGIFEAETVFGVTITNSASKTIPTRFIGEQHVTEDCRIIPTVKDWLRKLPIEPWMVLPHKSPPPVTGDPRDDWKAAVAAGQTTLGLKDWMARCALMDTA